MPYLPDRWDKCQDMIMVVIYVMLYRRLPTTQSLLDVAVEEL